MAIKIPTFDYATCIACNICADICPLSCIDMKKKSPGNLKKVFPILALPDTCTGCSICMNGCPVDSITMKSIVLVNTKKFYKPSLDIE